MTPPDMTLEAAIDMVLNGERFETLDHLPEEIRARVPVAREAANARARLANPARMAAMVRLLDVACTAPSRRKQVIWIQRAAQALSDAYSAQSACAKGCSHCCHIPVKIHQAEAEQIGRAIGRAPNSLPEQIEELHFEGYESPCPFLKSGTCSIYAHRPAVCRSHLNLDTDDLLCRLIPGAAVPVPYADSRPIQWALVTTSNRHERIADLRQWFSAAPDKS